MKACELIQFEKLVAQYFKDKKIRGPVHLSGGNEEYLIDFFEDVKEDDWVVSTHRWHYHWLLKGGDPVKALEHMVDRPNQTMAILDAGLKFVSTAIVGGGIPIAVGIGAGIKLDNGGDTVWCFVGDGALDSGAFYSAWRYVRCNELPVRFVVENNSMSCDSSLEDRWGKDIGCYGDMDGVDFYRYKRTYPHVGIGEYVCF